MRLAFLSYSQQARAERWRSGGASAITVVLTVLKWPLAILAVLTLPALAVSLIEVLVALWEGEVWRSAFGIGLAAGLVLWVTLKETRFVSFWSTMEHELTHALFAWLTLNTVLELRTSDGTLLHDPRQDDETARGSVGHILSDGSSWLVLASPYFFPTFAWGVWLAILALAEQPTWLAKAVLGAALVANVGSSYRETHVEQSDIQAIGKTFALLFLPAANLFFYGLLFAYEAGGSQLALDFAASPFSKTYAWIVEGALAALATGPSVLGP